MKVPQNRILLCIAFVSAALMRLTVELNVTVEEG